MANDAAERLRLALQMHDLGVEMMRARLRREHPEAPPEEIERRLEAWLQEPEEQHAERARADERDP